MFNMSKEIIIVLVIVLIIFGPTQLPKLAKMMGKSMKGLRDGIDGAEEPDAEAKPDADAKPKEVAAATEEKPAVEAKETKESAADDTADEIARLKAENARLAEAAKKAGSQDVE